MRRSTRVTRSLLPPDPVTDGLDQIRDGGKRALAQALSRIEAEPEAAQTMALLDAAYAAARAHTVGLTGPPGVGKSTLTGALIGQWREAGRTVGVIAVDPSSKLTGGALLGDRTRLRTDPADRGVFVRSMAARDRLGGLADLTVGALVLMRAVFDLVLVETVGVGQSETDVTGAVDTIVLCIQPGAGDALQFMKAGIVEIPDIVAVTKTDLGATAARAQADLAAALDHRERAPGDWPVAALGVSSMKGEGVGELADLIDRHGAHLAPFLSARRHAQAEQWLSQFVRERWGREGLKRAGVLGLAAGESPFSRLAELRQAMSPA
jgi:LAO/AO transport system kinase